MMKKYVRYAMLGLAIFALALLAGCGSGATGKGTPDGSSSLRSRVRAPRRRLVLDLKRREEGTEAHDQGLLPG